MSTQQVLFDAPGPRTRRRHLLYGVLGSLVVFGLLAWLLLQLWERGQITPDRFAPIFTTASWNQYILPGLRQTVTAALVSIVLAFIIGLGLAMGRMSELAPVRWATTVFVEFFRAVPVLIMMLFAYYALLYNTQVRGATLSFTAVVIGLVCYNAAVIAEVVRNGVGSLPSGQREAGLSIGLSGSQVRRMILVPQALTAMMPTLVSQLVVVLKDTALGYIILYPELLNGIRQMGSRFGNLTAAFIVGAALFILINWLITYAAERLEGRLKRRRRTAGKVADTDPIDQTVAAPTGSAGT